MVAKKKEEEKTVKTTLIIPETIWRKFCMKVIEKQGGRKNKAVLIKFMEDYVKMNK
jgi:hypothetical protein